MRSVSVRLVDLNSVRVKLGFVGENEHTTVLIDCKKAFDQYPNAVPSLFVTPPRGESYPAVVERDGNIISWTVTDSDLIYDGFGEFQLSFTQDSETVMKSDKCKTHILPSIIGSGNVPTPIENWLETASETLQELPDTAKQYALAALDEMTVDAEELPAGSEPAVEKTVDPDTGAINLNFKIPAGGGGTSDYEDLENKPSIGGVTLNGDTSLHDIGAAAESDIPDVSGLYTKPAGGIPAADLAEGVVPDVSVKANLTVVAPAFDQATANDAGSFVTHEGVVYLLPDGHTAGATWANTTKTATNIGAQLAGVLNDIDGITDSVEEFDSDLYSYEYLPVPMDEITATADLGLETGYISIYGDTGGTSSYHHTKKIAVGAGDVLEYKYNSGVQLDIRFVTAYNGETIVPSKGQSDQATSYTVPEGVTHVILSLANSQIDNIANLHRYYTAQGQKTKVFDVGAYVKRISKVGNIITAEEDSLTANTDLVLESNLDGKKEGRIDFWAKFSSFDSVTVGHGKGTYGGYIVIDDTNAVVYYNGTAYKTYTHGLTIADFIEVHIEQTDMAQAKFSITSSGGQWKSSENALWHGSKGDIFAKATTALSDIRFSASFPDMRKDVFVFGDSYITMGDDTRWPYYIKQTYNATNLALFGWGGEGSTDALTCFNKVLAMVKPKIVAWFIGMNDGDTSSAINSDWKTAIDEVISTCRTNGIKLVLATIPNTPTVRNTYKNAYVKESGLDYVDFAKAVNAESAGATWYTGMLSNDNVHPSVLGGKALACRLITDLPEIQ